MGDTLPRRDFILLPLLALLTLLVLAGAAELGARVLFAESGGETCGLPAGAPLPGMRPDCTSTRKAAEGPVTVSAYNDCGYRTPEPCRARTPGSFRVALMGASTAQGMKVPYEDTFAGRLSRALSQACQRPVEFQNMGVPGSTLLEIYRRTDEALAMRPDMLMLALSPYEMKALISDEDLARRDQPPAPRTPGADTPPARPRSWVGRLSDLAYNSRMLVATQHFLFQNRAAYTRLFLLHGEDADYLRVPYGAGWEKRLRDFEVLLGGMAERARAAGLPFMLVIGPQRIQASLLDPSVRPPGVDPFELGRRLAAISARHGVLFQDALTAFAQAPNPDDFFYAVDGHMDAAGHALFARAVLAGMTQGGGPLGACTGATLAGG